MKIAVASGKGGTGKTTIATSLALSLVSINDIWFIDCDVEAPNAHLFLRPMINDSNPATIAIPQINNELCTICGKCVEVCQFHALANVVKNIMVFPQLCHGCGSCTWNCPEKAIVEVANPIGKLESGLTTQGIHFSHGELTISEPMPTPIIRQLKRKISIKINDIAIYDSPPGASCSVVETLRGVDYALLVTEPTPFGLHDLKQMLGIVHDMKIPAGIIINRDGIGDNSMAEYLNNANLPVLMRIPFDKELAMGIASGKTLIDIQPHFKDKFLKLFSDISQQLSGGSYDSSIQ
jgi:MinD superfamily P-loop ATPase